MVDLAIEETLSRALPFSLGAAPRREVALANDPTSSGKGLLSAETRRRVRKSALPAKPEHRPRCARRLRSPSEFGYRIKICVGLWPPN